MKTNLTDAERRLYEDAASAVYNAIGHDMGWTLNQPSKATFVDVIVDQMDGPHVDLTREQIDRFRSLSFAEKKRIILTAL